MQPGNGAPIVSGGNQLLMPSSAWATHAQNSVMGLGRCKIRLGSK